MKKFFLFLFGIALLSATSYVAYYYIRQDMYIFNFPKVSSNYSYQWKFPHREVTMDTPANGKVNFVIFEAKTAEPKGIIAYFHGKGSHIGFKKWEPVIERYTSLGFDFLMLDYRGAGKSRGKNIEGEMLDDCNYVYQYLLDYYPEEAITIYGKSLGTSFATYVASVNNPRALILEAPFYNLFDVSCSTVPTMPPLIVRAILRYHLSTDEWIQKVKCPITIIHGTADTIIPYNSSERLKALIENDHQVDLTIIEGGDHDHLYVHDIFNQKIEEALGLFNENPVQIVQASEG